jgi:Flp pilus assembly protein CpaB
LKRSNRLVLLIGIFLALVAFVLIILMFNNNGGGQAGPSAAPTTTKVVVATKDIALGDKIQENQVGLKEIPLPAPAAAFGDTSFVIGQVARASVIKGQLVKTTVLDGGSGSIVGNIEVPAGLVAMSIKVNQVSGVGTVIKPGDYVDALVAFKITVIDTDPVTGVKTASTIEYGPSVKALLQGMQVLGTLLPPPTTSQAPAPSGSPPPAGTSTSLNDQQQIVILAMTLQQSEVLNYSQIQGINDPQGGPNGITLVLRSSKDYVDAAGSPSIPPDTLTTGVILSTLVAKYGVLPPNLTLAPAPSASPSASRSPSASPTP